MDAPEACRIGLRLGTIWETDICKLMKGSSNWQSKLLNLLYRPVDTDSLAVFRIAFGLLMLWEVWRYLRDGWVADLWIEPQFHFFFPLFSWVHPWPGNGIVWHFVGMGALAACIAIGFCYRLCMVLYWLAFTYIFLLDAAYFQNHFYLIALLSFLLIFLPANSRFALDARWRPAIAKTTMPAWCLWLLRFQMGLPYFFGGVAKLNVDWLRGEPMHLWLSALTDVPLFGPWLDRLWFAYFLSYCGIAIDLAAVPLLLYKRTRPYMFAALLGFHFTNARIFNIGVFPWFAIAATTIFFAPNWPQKYWQQCRDVPRCRVGFILGAIAGAMTVWFWSGWREVAPISVGALATGLTVVMVLQQRQLPVETVVTSSRAIAEHGKPWQQQAIVALLGLWAIVHLTLPLRHYFIPGNASWTEEGHRFSWRMKLRSKEGWVVFRAINPDNGTEAIVDPLELLADWQYARMLQRPYLIHQFALYLETVLQDAGIADPQLYARSHISLNGRPHQFLIDPTVDLTGEALNVVPAPWIFPLQTGGETERRDS